MGGNDEGGAPGVAIVSDFVCDVPRGIGVASAVLGDCGIGDRTESRMLPCKGIMGVMSGEDRGAGAMDGDTAGSIFGARTIVALLGPAWFEVALRAETSEEDRLRILVVGAPMSICVGAVPRCMRCCEESCELRSRARREESRCSSRTKP